MRVMSRLRVFLLNKVAVYLLAVGLFLAISPALALAEQINKFEVEIEPSSNGSFLVTENIDYDFGELEKHGIFRYIPTKHSQPASSWYKERYINIGIKSITHNGEEVEYEADEVGDFLYLKIGDPNKTITGEHNYKLSYRVSGALWSQDTTPNPELYWNVTGHGWEVPILSVKASIIAPPGFLAKTNSCFVGNVGDTTSCDSTTSATTTTFSARGLAPGVGMTIAQSLIDRRVVTQSFERVIAWIPWTFVILIWILILGFSIYKYRTKHKPETAIVAEYEPLPDFLPMFTGVLFDGRLDSRDITAGLLYLAEQGFILIAKTNKKVFWLFETTDYEITLKRPMSEIDSSYLLTVSQLLFPYVQLDATEETMNLSEMRSDSKWKYANLKKVRKLRKAVMNDLLERGYFEEVVPREVVLAVFIGLILMIPLVSLLVSIEKTIFMPITVLILGSIAVFMLAVQRRTKKGYESLNHLKGFKRFLAVTEKDRYKFHNAPQKSPQQFMQYLPYAVAFGVEEEWAETFKDITITNPGWYQGDSAATFSALTLTKDLGSFSTHFTASSGSSPSSGGGSAGGGTGGGGGGSW